MATASASDNASIIDQLPQPPEGSVFRLLKVETICQPHPFCITPTHVAYASDRCGGMLTAEAIIRSGGRCGVRGCNLSYRQHEQLLTVFIGVPNNRGDLNAVPGLVAYLVECKKVSEEKNLGIQGFAFPNL